MKVVHVGLPNLVAVQMELPQLLVQMVKDVKIHVTMMMEDLDVVKMMIVTVRSQSISVVLMEFNQQ